MSDAILCHNLYKQYDSGKKTVDAVNGLDLTVRQGECFGLLGPNGAGKTTTIEILEGLLAASSGDVEVLGMRWGTGRDLQLRQRIGITLQDTRLPVPALPHESEAVFGCDRDARRGGSRDS